MNLVTKIAWSSHLYWFSTPYNGCRICPHIGNQITVSHSNTIYIYAVITKCVSFSTCIWKTIQNLVIAFWQMKEKANVAIFSLHWTILVDLH